MNESTFRSENTFTFQTGFNPVFGVDEDINDFVASFTGIGSYRFVDFAKLWRERKFIHMIHGRTNQQGLYDITGCIFHRLVNLFHAHAGRDNLVCVCALYLMYAFFGKQPIRNHVRLRVCPVTWSNILQVVKDVREDGHLDVYFIFRKLCSSNAFLFCATRQPFYPGAPLFDSPSGDNRMGDDSADDSSSKNLSQFPALLSRRDLATQRLPVVKALKSLASDLNQSIKCLSLSLSRYTESKRLLTQHIGPKDEVHTDCFGGDIEDDSVKCEFLDGFNFIKYPDSLTPLQTLAMELEKSRGQACPTFDTSSRRRNSSTNLMKTDKTEEANTDIPSSSTSAPLSSSPSVNIDVCPPADADVIVGFDRRRKDSKHKRRSSEVESSIQTRQSTFKVSKTDDDSPPCNNASIDPPTENIGMRRRLLRNPSTWSAELAKQAEDVHRYGCHRDRRRPTKSKFSSKY